MQQSKTGNNPRVLPPRAGRTRGPLLHKEGGSSGGWLTAAPSEKARGETGYTLHDPTYVNNMPSFQRQEAAAHRGGHSPGPGPGVHPRPRAQLPHAHSAPCLEAHAITVCVTRHPTGGPAEGGHRSVHSVRRGVPGPSALHARDTSSAGKDSYLRPWPASSSTPPPAQPPSSPQRRGRGSCGFLAGAGGSGAVCEAATDPRSKARGQGGPGPALPS